MSIYPLTKYPVTVNGLVLWLDASDISTIIHDAGKVSKILDKSGKSNYAVQSVENNRPTTGIRSVAGKNVIDFDPSVQAQYLQFTSNKAVSVPFTVFVVAGLDSSANQSILSRQTGAVAGHWTLIKNGGFNIFQTYAFGSAGLASGSVKTFNSNTNIHCIHLAEGSTLRYSLNNDTLSGDANTISGYDNNVALKLVLGASPSGINPMDGFIAEVLVYNKIMSVGEIGITNRYLSNKWGVLIS